MFRLWLSHFRLLPCFPHILDVILKSNTSRGADNFLLRFFHVHVLLLLDVRIIIITENFVLSRIIFNEPLYIRSDHVGIVLYLWLRYYLFSRISVWLWYCLSLPLVFGQTDTRSDTFLVRFVSKHLLTRHVTSGPTIAQIDQLLPQNWINARL